MRLRDGGETLQTRISYPTRKPAFCNKTVDTNLKFEGYDNLYCADPSIWPFIPAANPALTLAALSQRLAKILIAKL